jgi:hypothetical protein
MGAVAALDATPAPGREDWRRHGGLEPALLLRPVRRKMGSERCCYRARDADKKLAGSRGRPLPYRRDPVASRPDLLVGEARPLTIGLCLVRGSALRSSRGSEVSSLRRAGFRFARRWRPSWQASGGCQPSGCLRQRCKRAASDRGGRGILWPRSRGQAGASVMASRICWMPSVTPEVLARRGPGLGCP